MTITLVFDEGPGAGLGHRRRCEHLAAALHTLGVPTELRPLRPGGHVEAAVLLVDSYLARADDTDRFRAGRVLAIDDIARDLAVDLVVDPDPGADAAHHTRAGRVLAGATYALVDPSLRDLVTVPVDRPVERVLVTTGGADAAGIGGTIATACKTLLPDVEVRCVEGPWGAPVNDPDVHTVRAPAALGGELAAADIVVTAGGVTLLEACALGRPVVACAIAANQTGSVAGAAHVGAVLATDPSSAPDVVTRLAHDGALRARLATAATTLVDGQGATRVAAAVAAIASQESQFR